MAPNVLMVITNVLSSAWEANDLIVLSTESPSDSQIVGSHCYAMVGYNPSSSNPFQMYNPWGTTASGWAPGYTNSKYGLFSANATFIEKNFSSQSLECGAGTLHNFASSATKPATGYDAIGTLDFTAAFLRVPLRILGYCVMPNHWHMVVRPADGLDHQVSDFCVG